MTKKEIIFTISILTVIGIAGAFNLAKSKVLARDIQRKNDLKHIASALADFRRDVGRYPYAESGKMVACGDLGNPRACEWALDSLISSSAAYLTPIPEDPLSPPKSYEYYYVSNVRDFQLFAHLERKDDAEYKKEVEVRKLPCGTQICNFGISSDVNSPPEGELQSGELK